MAVNAVPKASHLPPDGMFIERKTVEPSPESIEDEKVSASVDCKSVKSMAWIWVRKIKKMLTKRIFFIILYYNILSDKYLVLVTKNTDK